MRYAIGVSGKQRKLCHQAMSIMRCADPTRRRRITRADADGTDAGAVRIGLTEPPDLPVTKCVLRHFEQAVVWCWVEFCFVNFG